MSNDSSRKGVGKTPPADDSRRKQGMPQSNYESCAQQCDSKATKNKTK